MRKAVPQVLMAALLGLGLVLFGAPQAQAQTSFYGDFVGPHGRFSIGVGAPAFPVGSYVPYGYRVIRRPSYGYGFYSRPFYCQVHRVRHVRWVPVRRYGSQWIVASTPVCVTARPRYIDGGWEGYDDDGDDDFYGDDDVGYERYGPDSYGYDRYPYRGHGGAGNTCYPNH